MRFQLLLFLLLGIFFSIKAQDPMQLIDHVQQGNLSHVKNLVNSSNVNTLNAQQENLLLIATRNNNLPMAKLLIEKGANPAYICATHPIFSDDALFKLNHPGIHEIVITDSIAFSPPDQRYRVLSIAPLLGKAIQIIYEGGSISSLFRTSM